MDSPSQTSPCCDQRYIAPRRVVDMGREVTRAALQLLGVLHCERDAPVCRIACLFTALIDERGDGVRELREDPERAQRNKPVTS